MHTAMNLTQSASGPFERQPWIAPSRRAKLLLPSPPKIMRIGVSLPRSPTADFYPWNISDLVISVLFCCAAHRWALSRRPILLPPGPKGLPVLGNSCQIPTHKQWLEFDEWIEEYGTLCARPLGLSY